MSCRGRARAWWRANIIDDEANLWPDLADQDPSHYA